MNNEQLRYIIKIIKNEKLIINNKGIINE